MKPSIFSIACPLARAGRDAAARAGEERPLLERLFQLHPQRWIARGAAGMFADPQLREFHRGVAARFTAHGLLRLFGLSVNREVIAVQYDLALGRRRYYYFSGFGSEWSRCSPGGVVLAETVRAAYNKGVRELDFLRHSEEFKYQWGGRDQVNWRLEWMPAVASEREVA